eukprot:TRINITY_DN23331_c0_g1_i1.p2 TRINITY_DN23331_c0_g1~~TRINITY_DN23331_c0_g1_i1.p2  ORF type:complete len:366 (-),score=192.66 TRINITY_DN23331_c0_g1_i1:60-1097(-)
MCIRDSFMDDYSVCYVEDKFKYNLLKASCNNRKASYFRFQVTQKGNYYITVNQKSTRKYPIANNYEYPSVFLVVAQEVRPGEYKYVEANADCYKEVWVDGELEPGNYVAYVKILWAHPSQEEFTISTYGPADARLKQVPKNNVPEFLAATFVDFARRSGTNISPVDKQGQAMRGELPEEEFGGFQYVYYRNRGNFTVYESLNFQGCEGITLVKPHRGMQTNVVVPPGKEAIVLARCDPRYYKFAVGISTRLSAGQPEERNPVSAPVQRFSKNNVPMFSKNQGGPFKNALNKLTKRSGNGGPAQPAQFPQFPLTQSVQPPLNVAPLQPTSQNFFPKYSANLSLIHI